jgi:4-amino-4-deoxy-L-arabinose transferase-like glycosyltransferase
MRLLPGGEFLPRLLLVLILAVWTVAGVWLIFQAPYLSGTDESIRYVAFAAAANRPAGDDDFRRYGVEHYYYPPLYFLLFAPWYGPEPEFLEAYPQGNPFDPAYHSKAGRVMISKEWLAGVPPKLVSLYRTAKLVSLALGLAALLCIAAAHLVAFPGPGRWWLALLGTMPVALLPQFLYYHTLCNNDALLNALAAAAVLCALKALVAADWRRHAAWSLAAAALAGLAVLTKQTGVVLLAIFPFLMLHAGGLVRRGGLPRRRLLALGTGLVLVFVAAGGWWLLWQAGQGDPAAMGAHRQAHPWAFRSLSPSWGWFREFSWSLLRSYFGLFMGAVFGIPDLVFLAYLLPPACLAVGSLFLVRRRREPGGPGQRVVPWTMLLSLLLVNLLLVALNDLSSIAPYGRLLFPSLTAIHLMATAMVVHLAGDRRRVAAVALAGLTWWGALFGWTVVRRMVPAVLQPAERVVNLSASTTTDAAGEVMSPPRWRFQLQQQVRLPPGILTGMRMEIRRPLQVPQLGASLRGELVLSDPAGRLRRLPLKKAAIGDNDATGRWTDLELENPWELTVATDAWINLEAGPPWFEPIPSAWHLPTAHAARTLRSGPAVVEGKSSGLAFSLAAVYTP